MDPRWEAHALRNPRYTTTETPFRNQIQSPFSMLIRQNEAHALEDTNQAPKPSQADLKLTMNGSANGQNIPTDVEGLVERVYRPETLAVHADDKLNSYTDVAPALHVSTTFRYDNANLNPVGDEELDPLTAAPVYSRLAQPNTTRLEAVLSALLNGHAITYSSGLSAFHAMLVFFRPNTIAISDGYHGCHGVIRICSKLWGLQQVDLFDESSWGQLGPGDIIHVETPLNPTGEARDLAYFKRKAAERGALLTVDATFAPPPLQDPFKQGADCIMHSGTKYFGGHSDMLCGVLAVPPERRRWLDGLWSERMYLGSVMGNMEQWLGVRSLRTLELRVVRQSVNCTNLVAWLDSAMRSGEAADQAVAKTVVRVQHASLQLGSDQVWIKKQMPGGFGPVFSMLLRDQEMARKLPGKLKLFHHATSLGGVESLIEWRRMSDSAVDERLLRVSVGVENWEDLKDDFTRAFEELAAGL